MALLIECRLKCAPILIDNADIVREAIYRQLRARFPVSELSTIRPVVQVNAAVSGRIAPQVHSIDGLPLKLQVVEQLTLVSIEMLDHLVEMSAQGH